MYAAPLWATEHKDLLDSIQDIFIRRFLNLPRYTPGYIIRLETGRISLSVTALKLTLKYWLRVLNMSSDRLPRICFKRTRELSNASGTPIGFIKKLTNLFNNKGSPALVPCDDPETLRSAITGLLKTAADQSIQNDLTRLDKSKLYSHYKDIHISFMTEGYLLGDFPFPVVRLLAQVRILSSFFRENHTKMLCGEDPICTFCNSKLKNEITHYIFDCSALKEERRTLMLKTGQLCASLPSIIDNMTQNKYIATAFYGFHKSISQKKANSDVKNKEDTEAESKGDRINHLEAHSKGDEVKYPQTAIKGSESVNTPRAASENADEVKDSKEAGKGKCSGTDKAKFRMKSTVAVVLLLAALCHSQPLLLDAEMETIWQNYKTVYEKTYSSYTEETLRKKILHNNIHKIIKHNMKYELGMSSYRMGLNKYADMVTALCSEDVSQARHFM
ncbi:hypothetical protein LAZ67_3003137 [Cordylochernes scorpioides]|uniref:Cathepsin propeptide inhibitor domain-containing protein n=1 Tax=Cordylochernes scorpioides TaxID=51811 RepID=A0ABY6KBH8_9ARAC|nr:hypothetical protein LAZ67_3003137 [Cordylochernes scorpioides]